MHDRIADHSNNRTRSSMSPSTQHGPNPNNLFRITRAYVVLLTVPETTKDEKKKMVGSSRLLGSRLARRA